MTEREWEEMVPFRKYEATDVVTGEKFRIAKESEEVGFQYAKGKSRRGYRLGKDYMLKRYQLVIKDENAAWHKRINRVLKAIGKTGLWTNLVPYFENLQKMDYEDVQSIRKIAYSRLNRHARKGLPETDNEDFKKDYGEFFTAYPFIFTQDTTGMYYLDNNYVSELADVKIKSTYFGYFNKETKERIARAIAGNEKLRERARVGYDVTYEFDPAKKKAWYSEEYRDCGNGHYYYAFDENLAVFCEDD